MNYSVKLFIFVPSTAIVNRFSITGLFLNSTKVLRFTVRLFFILGSSRVLSVVNQIVGQKSNALNSNIHKPKSVSSDSTASTNDKEVRQKDWLYTLRDK